jgi:hypothetical protein
MVALTVTAAQVQADEAGSIQYDDAGEAIAPGKAIYYDSDAEQWKLADADAVATVPANKIAIAVSQAAGSGQMVGAQKSGSPVLGAGAAPVVGTMYYVGLTPGDIVPEGDLGSGDFVTLLGIGASGNTILMRPWGTETAKA